MDVELSIQTVDLTGSRKYQEQKGVFDLAMVNYTHTDLLGSLLVNTPQDCVFPPSPPPSPTRFPPPGETIRIVIEEYVQHLSGYLLQLKFDPTLLFGSQFQYGNRISLEFSQLYHWHPLMPDTFLIKDDELTYPQFLFNTSVLTSYGVETLVDAFSKQVAGQVKMSAVLPLWLLGIHVLVAV